VKVWRKVSDVVPLKICAGLSARDGEQAGVGGGLLDLDGRVERRSDVVEARGETSFPLLKSVPPAPLTPLAAE